MTAVKELLRADDGVQSMASLYAALNDWYANIHQERKGVRACERVTRIQEDGLVPTAQRYFEHIAAEHGHEFTGNAEDLLDQWADDFRPDYVKAADNHHWDEYNRSLTRGLLDAETRIAREALERGIDVNNVTINVRDEDELPAAVQDEFDDLWGEWFHRLDDLYWNRRNRLYKQIVEEIEGGYVESEDKTWERYKERYPQLPPGTVVGGEQI